MTLRPYRFIVADDDHETRFFVRRILLRHYPGSEVFEAANGEEALEFYDRSGADLMVIDYQIPFINGVDLIRELRGRKAVIPLVMASEHPEAREQAMSAGATVFLEKKTLNPSLGYFLPALLPKQKDNGD